MAPNSPLISLKSSCRTWGSVMFVLLFIILRGIKERLRAYLIQGTRFAEALREILFSYRTAQHGGTKRTPAELMMGRQLRTPLKMLSPVQNVAGGKPDVEVISRSVYDRKEKAKQYADAKRAAIPSQFKVGDWVRVRRPRRGKIVPQLSAPARIIQQFGQETYCLQDDTKWHARNLVGSEKEGFHLVRQDLEEGVDAAEGSESVDEDAAEGGESVDGDGDVRRSERVINLPKRFADYETDFGID
eukprot:m.206357 g.206357  ORF g.206357 m.206357 type:complete len:244 (+) comp39674_c0_seq2:507-1238(+)